MPLLGSDPKMRSAVIKILIRPRALVFDSDMCCKYFYKSVLDIRSKGLIPVMSHERLAGNPHSGGYDSKELADRIAEVFPDGKVLIIIREQESIIVSSYKQYVRNGGPCSLEGYLFPPSSDSRIPLFDFVYFEYHRLIRHYMKLFGGSNVLVLPYELFKDDPRKFVLKIVRFAGANPKAKMLDGLPYSKREYATLSGFSIAVKRSLNRVVARRDTVNPSVILSIPRGCEVLLEQFLERLGWVMPSWVQRSLDERLKREVRKLVDKRYGESNEVMSEVFGIELQKYGYDLS